MNIGQAKNIPIDRLLATLGFQPAFEKKGELWYNSPFRPSETEPSFHVTPSRRGWKDFGNGERGGNILDFVMLYFNLGNNLSAALAKLDSIEGIQPGLFATQRPVPTRTTRTPRPANLSRTHPPRTETTPSSELRITKVQVIAHPALIGYLNTRGISGQLAREYLKEIHYTQNDKPYFALGFENNSGGYELRNPYYQGSTPPKDITSIELARVSFGKEPVAIFEGFFDYLSALATHTITSQTAAIILNSAALKEWALSALRQHKPAQVNLFLDRDPAGSGLVSYFQERLKGVQVFDQSNHYDGYKDFNEMHQAQKHKYTR